MVRVVRHNVYCHLPVGWGIKQFHAMYSKQKTSVWYRGRHMIIRYPYRENVQNILAICLPIMTMQHISMIRESSSASHAMGISAWNDPAISGKPPTQSRLHNFIQIKVSSMVISPVIMRKIQKMWKRANTYPTLFARVQNGCSHDFKFAETSLKLCNILYQAIYESVASCLPVTDRQGKS